MLLKLEEYVVKAVNGDKSAFEIIYKETFNSSYFLALKMLKNEQDALDIVQDSFVEIFSAIGNLKKPESFESWLRQITANNCRDHLKKNKAILFENEQITEQFAEIIEDDMEFLPAEALESKETANEVMNIVDSLPDEQKTAIYLYYYNRMSVAHIAEFFSCSEGTVKSRLYSARAKIKTGAEEYNRKGISLYSLTGVPVLVAILLFAKKQMVVESAVVTSSFTAVATKTNIIANVVSNVPPKAQPLVGEQAVVSATVKGTAASLSVGKKIAIAVASIVVAGGTAVGGAVGISHLVNKDKVEVPDEPTSAIVQEYEEETTEEVAVVQKDYLEAGSSDYEVFTELMADIFMIKTDFDCTSEKAAKDVRDILMNEYFSSIVYDNFFDDYIRVDTKDDPIGKFPMYDGWTHFKFPVKSMDWIITNVFNQKPDHTINTDACYYKDGYYYVGLIPSGPDFYETSISKTIRNDDGSYTFTVKCEITGMGEEGPYITEYYNVHAALKEDKGKHYWSIFSFRDNNAKSEQQNNSPEWKTAYNKFLKSYYDQGMTEDFFYPEDMRFDFAYIDGDNIPELLVSTGTARASMVEVFSYKKGEVVQTGSYGTFGTMSYVEKNSLIISEYYKNGNFWGTLYRMNSNGSASEIFNHFSNGASGDPLVYKINDKEVSETEYDRQMIANWPDESKIKTSGMGYYFDYASFDNYCS